MLICYCRTRSKLNKQSQVVLFSFKTPQTRPMTAKANEIQVPSYAKKWRDELTPFGRPFNHLIQSPERVEFLQCYLWPAKLRPGLATEKEVVVLRLVFERCKQNPKFWETYDICEVYITRENLEKRKPDFFGTFPTRFDRYVEKTRKLLSPKSPLAEVIRDAVREEIGHIRRDQRQANRSIEGDTPRFWFAWIPGQDEAVESQNGIYVTSVPTSVSGAETDMSSRMWSKTLDRSTSSRLSSVKDLFSFSQT
jgi:hypothetical protein